MDDELIFAEMFGMSLDEFHRDRWKAKIAVANLEALDRFSKATAVDELLKMGRSTGLLCHRSPQR